MVLKVGITGGIGSGKSTVAKIFELLHVPIYYADAASKNLYQTNEQLKSAIKMQFGEDVYSGDQLNRSLLASIVFNDPEKLQLLNSLVHPLTIEDAEQWMQAQTAPYVLKEAALIFESGSAAMLDFVIGVQAPVHLRIKRVMDREGISREAVLQRMDRQIDESIKMRLCDFIIYNNEQELIIPQVLKLDSTLRQIAHTRT